MRNARRHRSRPRPSARRCMTRPNKPMHLSGAVVLKEFIVFVWSLVPCNVRLTGRSLGGRLQLMGRSVRPQDDREGGSVELETLPHHFDATRIKRSQALRVNTLRLATLLWLLSALGCGAVPETYRGPPARAGVVVGWRVDLDDRPGQELHVRNNTKDVVRITRITFSECINVSGCVEFDPDITLQPGERRFVTIVAPNDPTRPFSFRWRWRYRRVTQDRGT